MNEQCNQDNYCVDSWYVCVCAMPVLASTTTLSQWAMGVPSFSCHRKLCAFCFPTLGHLRLSTHSIYTQRRTKNTFEIKWIIFLATYLHLQRNTYSISMFITTFWCRFINIYVKLVTGSYLILSERVLFSQDFDLWIFTWKLNLFGVHTKTSAKLYAMQHSSVFGRQWQTVHINDVRIIDP